MFVALSIDIFKIIDVLKDVRRHTYIKMNTTDLPVFAQKFKIYRVVYEE
jgi:hypothetical protein